MKSRRKDADYNPAMTDAEVRAMGRKKDENGIWRTEYEPLHTRANSTRPLLPSPTVTHIVDEYGELIGRMEAHGIDPGLLDRPALGSFPRFRRRALEREIAHLQREADSLPDPPSPTVTPSPSQVNPDAVAEVVTVATVTTSQPNHKE